MNKSKSFKTSITRYAIICTMKDGSEFIHKDYADMDRLKIGESRLLQGRWRPKAYRLAKVRITTEEETV